RRHCGRHHAAAVGAAHDQRRARHALRRPGLRRLPRGGGAAHRRDGGHRRIFRAEILVVLRGAVSMTPYFAVSAVSAFFGAGAFALLFHAPRRTILPSCLIAALGYLLYVVL